VLVFGKRGTVILQRLAHLGGPFHHAFDHTFREPREQVSRRHAEQKGIGQQLGRLGRRYPAFDKRDPSPAAAWQQAAKLLLGEPPAPSVRAQVA